MSGTGKATTFKFCMHIYGLNWNKRPLKISGKVAVGVVRDSRKFSAFLLHHVSAIISASAVFAVVSGLRLSGL